MGINLSSGAMGVAKRLPEEILVAATAPIAPKKTPEKIRTPADPTPEKKSVQFFSKSETKPIIDKFKPLPPVLRTALRDTQILHREFKAIERLTRSPESPTPSVGVNRSQETPIIQKETSPVEPTDPALAESFQNRGSSQSDEVKPVLADRFNDEVDKANLVLQKENEAPKKIVLAAINHELKTSPRFSTVPDPEIRANRNEPAKVSQLPAPPKDLSEPQPLRPLVPEQPPIADLQGKEEGRRVELPKTALPVRDFPNAGEGERISKKPLLNRPVPEDSQPRPLKPSTFLDRVISALSLNRPASNSGELRLGRQRVFEAFQRRVRSGAVHDFVDQARQVVRSLETHPLAQAISETGIVTHRNVRFAGVVPAPQVPDLVDSRINGPSFRIETVAQIPSREDNGFRSQPVQDRERGSLVPDHKKGPDHPLVRVGPPPLTNLNPPQRPLPTNVRSRLVKVSSVNLLDLVL